MLSFVIGVGVGPIYALPKAKSPAPSYVALIGLLSIVIGKQLLHILRDKGLP